MGGLRRLLVLLAALGGALPALRAQAPGAPAVAEPARVAAAPVRPRVVVLGSDAGGPYQEAALALRRGLQADGPDARTEVRELALEAWPGAGPAPAVLVALGSAACDRAAAAVQRHPVLCALLPLESFERILQTHQRKASPALTALVLNQPLSRQLDLLQLALPSARRVGVLWGPQALRQSAALQVQAQRHGLSLVEATVADEDQLAAGLRSVLASADVLLAVADPVAYNPTSVHSILLLAMRERVPVVAFSPAYVRAGALMALFASPTQVGQQAAALVRQALLGHPLPATPVPPAEFSVEVNAPVARALGLSLGADALLAQLRKREGLP